MSDGKGRGDKVQMVYKDCIFVVQQNVFDMSL